MNYSKYLKYLIKMNSLLSGRLFSAYYIYTTGSSLVGKIWSQQLKIDIFRWIVGFIGSAMMLWFLYTICYNQSHRIIFYISYIGVNSIGIYLVSDVIYRYLMPRITDSFAGFGVVVMIVETVMVLGFSCFSSNLIKKVPFLNSLLFGAR